jgi:hypothetical protein
LAHDKGLFAKQIVAYALCRVPGQKKRMAKRVPCIFWLFAVR